MSSTRLLGLRGQCEQRRRESIDLMHVHVNLSDIQDLKTSSDPVRLPSWMATMQPNLSTCLVARTRRCRNTCKLRLYEVSSVVRVPHAHVAGPFPPGKCHLTTDVDAGPGYNGNWAIEEYEAVNPNCSSPSERASGKSEFWCPQLGA